MTRRTTVAIRGDDFLINGQLTYAGRTWRGVRIEGLLMNARLVQGTFDDLNDETRAMWNYPPGAGQADGPWDAERNTREFVAAMPDWRAHGLVGFTLNLQGGNPQAYTREQPWHNSAFRADGSLRPDTMSRLERILDEADHLGMVPILGLFYFGQDHRLADEAAVLRAADAAVDWVIERGYTNVLIEVANECNIRYTHAIIKPPRAHELVVRVRERSAGRVDSPAGRLLVSTSFSGGAIPTDEVAREADFHLIHGNGVKGPDAIRAQIDACRALGNYRGQPVVYNEDDHFDFDRSDNHMIAAVGRHASWGLFDWRMSGEGYDEGYQSVPVNWTISSDRKRGFFGLLREMTRGQ